jgi:LysR substrate binding domain
VQAPLRLVRRLLDGTPELLVELSMRRSLAAALEALGRGELDACFGRVHDLDRPWPAGLADRPIVLERAVAAVSAEHRLADAPLLDPADLKDSLLWMPAAATSSELLGVWRRFAEHFGIAMDTGGQNLGLEHAVDQLRRDPRRFALFGRDWRVPAEATIRLISLEPTPCYLCSLVWREGDRHPLLGLLQQAVATGRTEGWLAYDPQRDWLPDIDLAGLRRHLAVRGRAPVHRARTAPRRGPDLLGVWFHAATLADNRRLSRQP